MGSTRWLRRVGLMVCWLIGLTLLLFVGYQLTFAFLARLEYKALEQDLQALAKTGQPVTATQAIGSPLPLGENAVNFYATAQMTLAPRAFGAPSFDDLIKPLLTGYPNEAQLSTFEHPVYRALRNTTGGAFQFAFRPVDDGLLCRLDAHSADH
jgi:hypothetical protein